MWDLWVIDLKSNMDRFIGLKLKQDFRAYKYLKSNMDRFIANFPSLSATTALYLKSNMDRFIESEQ